MLWNKEKNSHRNVYEGPYLSDTLNIEILPFPIKQLLILK